MNLSKRTSSEKTEENCRRFYIVFTKLSKGIGKKQGVFLADFEKCADEVCTSGQKICKEGCKNTMSYQKNG